LRQRGQSGASGGGQMMLLNGRRDRAKPHVPIDPGADGFGGEVAFTGRAADVDGDGLSLPMRPERTISQAKRKSRLERCWLPTWNTRA